MINFKQVITDANTEYIYSVDVGALENAFASVEELLGERTLNEANRANCEALRMRLACKIFALKYFDGFAKKWVDRLGAFVDENLNTAVEKGYNKSVAVMKGTLEFLRTVSGYMGLKDELSALAKSDSVLLGGGNNLIAQAQKISDELTAIETASPFGDNVNFIDIKEKLGESLEYWKKSIIGAYSRALERSVSCRKLELGDCDYFPLPEYDEGGKAKAIILNTPFLDEARLYASHAIKKDEELFEFDANSFGESTEAISRVFMLIEYKRCAAFISHAEMLSADKQKALLHECMCAGKKGFPVFVMDIEGGTLYDMAIVVAAGDEHLSALDISSSYITMPSFDDVCEEIKSLKIASDSDCAEKLREMPFLGFMGLNEITKPENLKNWYTRGKKISEQNAVAAKKYLSKLRASMLFIDDGWGSFKSGMTATTEVGEFDYDDIKGIDLENIKKIVNSGATIFGKCGIISRYCTTGTADVSVWNSMERDEMLERLTLAVKLVYRVLMVPINPEVCLMDELSNPGAGGMCKDGGKQISFKYECCRGDIAYTRSTIVHECFHALQAKLRDGNWTKWYYDNMGITRGRACRWQITRQIYDDNVESNVYKVHMYEADAKAFEVDCQDGLDAYWNTIDFD